MHRHKLGIKGAARLPPRVLSAFDCLEAIQLASTLTVGTVDRRGYPVVVMQDGRLRRYTLHRSEGRLGSRTCSS